MEKRIVVSKRFRKNAFQVYEYLLNEHSKKIAVDFLDKLQRRVDLIIQYPQMGKPSQKRQNVRSVTLLPHNRIYYRLHRNTIELLCVFDMRKRKQPY